MCDFNGDGFLKIVQTKLKKRVAFDFVYRVKSFRF